MSVRKRKWVTKGVEKESWVVDYVDGQGTRRLKTFTKKKEADAFAANTAVEVRDGRHVADRASITVAEAAKQWIKTCKANGLERTTIEAYQSHVDLHIVPLIGSTLVSKITVPIVRDYEDKLRAGGRSAAMLKRAVGSLGAIISDAQERGLATHNAVREMRTRRKGKDRLQEQRAKGKLKVGVDIPTREEVKALVGALQGRWRPLLMTAIFCGLRASELRGLRWEDIDLDRRELHVNQRADRYNDIGRPKSVAGERTLPIPTNLANTLREWKLACPKGELGLAFPNGVGKAESYTNIVNRGLKPAMIAAGVTTPRLDDNGRPMMSGEGKPLMKAKYTGLHALRHFYASWCINPVSHGGMGLQPKVAQERLGHASIAMTLDVYGHLFPRMDTANEVDAAERSLLS